MQELQDLPSAKLPAVDTRQALDKNNWAYKTLENISKKHGLLVGKANEKFDINKPLSRSEAAVILVSLVGKINADNVQLTEAEKAQVDILKQEFSEEITQLTGRVASVESSVDTLKGNVSTLQSNDSSNLKTSFGKNFSISGLMQARYTGSLEKGASSYDNSENFSIPITNVYIKGKMQDHITYNVELLPFFTSGLTGATGSLGIADCFAATDIIPHHTLMFGQTRVPTGYEATLSPANVDTVMKSQIARLSTGYGDQWDMGLKLAGKWKYFDYFAGVYDGSGLNSISYTNSGMKYSGWGVLKPFAGHETQLGALELGGGLTYNGSATGVYVHDGSSISYTNTSNLVNYYGSWKYGKFGVRTEIAYADGIGYSLSGTGGSGQTVVGSAAAGNRSNGWYVEPSYYLTKKLQIVAKYDQFNPDRQTTDNLIREYTVGSNYYLANNNLKLQLNLVEVENQAAKNSQKIVVQTQYAF